VVYEYQGSNCLRASGSHRVRNWLDYQRSDIVKVKSRFIIGIMGVSSVLVYYPVSSSAQKVSLPGLPDVAVVVRENADGPKESRSLPGLEKVEERVRQMREAINKANEQLKRTNRSDEEKIASLDTVLVEIEAVLSNEIGEKGQISIELDRAITMCESKQRQYEDKAANGDLSPKNREVYLALGEKFKKETDGLRSKRILLRKQRSDLAERRDNILQDKQLYVDLMTADEIVAANAALTVVIDSVGEVVRSIDSFAAGMITPSVEPSAPGREMQ